MNQEQTIEEEIQAYGHLIDPLETKTLNEFPDIPFEFLVEPYFVKNGINLITAPPKSFKSILITHLSVECTRNGLFLGKFKTNKIQKVLLIDQENIKSQIKFRIQQFGGDITKFSMPLNPVYFDKTKNLTVKIANLVKGEGIDLIVIDTLRRTNLKMNENLSEETNQLFAKLNVLKDLASIILIHHETKPSFQNPYTRYRGSSDIAGAVDSHISLKDLKQPAAGIRTFTIVHEHSRYQEPYPPIKVEFNSAKGFEFKFLQETLTHEKISDEKLADDLLSFIETAGVEGRSQDDIQEFLKGKFGVGRPKAQTLRLLLEQNDLITKKEKFKGQKTHYFTKEVVEQQHT